MSTDVRSQSGKSSSESDEPIVRIKPSKAKRSKTPIITYVTLNIQFPFMSISRLSSDCDSLSEGNVAVQTSAANKRTKNVH